MEHQILPTDYNSYGSRRGNHEVMMRGTFANIRIRNEMAPGTEGGFTKLYPEEKVMPVYNAVEEYKKRGTDLAVIGGKEYGTGSSMSSIITLSTKSYEFRKLHQKLRFSN